MNANKSLLKVGRIHFFLLSIIDLHLDLRLSHLYFIITSMPLVMANISRTRKMVIKMTYNEVK